MLIFFFFKQKTAYEMRISDWSSDVCSSDLTGSYAHWVARYDTLTSERMEELRARAESLGAGGPLFSILLPIYQTPERWLRRCIESVLAQVYSNWQLCIVDDASPDMRAMEVVEEYARGDESSEFIDRKR